MRRFRTATSKEAFMVERLMRHRNIFILCILAALLVAFISGSIVGKSKGVPFVNKIALYSIGIYEGDSPLNISPPASIRNPVLTAKDVTDIRARFVADPFMVKEDATWYMFFEAMNIRSRHGDIGLAVSSNGLNWRYQQIVLDEPFHLSYPYVFRWNNEYYMIPESSKANSVRLYRAAGFPSRWSFVGNLLKGYFIDPSIFFYENRWWIFSQTNRCATLSLYYADDLMGPYTEHPKSPIIRGDGVPARPGGRVIVLDDRIIRYAQDHHPTNGLQLCAFEITGLTTATYEEKLVAKKAILKGSGTGWNAKGMHHIDAHRIEAKNRWMACVDGYYKGLVFGLQY